MTSIIFATNLFVDSVDGTTADRGARNFFRKFEVGLLHLSSSLVIVTQVTGLAHANGVVESISVLAVPCKLVSTELSIARWTHVFSVVFSWGVWTLRNFHRVFSWFHIFDWFDGSFSFFLIDSWSLLQNTLLSLFVDKFFLNEVLEQLSVHFAWNIRAVNLAFFLVSNHLRKLVKDLHFQILCGN